MKVYNLHRAWQKTFDRVNPDGTIKSESEVSLAAFRAGMWVAADIIEEVLPEYSHVRDIHIEDKVKERAAKKIRAAANE